MSTRALVGVEADGLYSARYVHSDGYPAYMLPALRQVWCYHERELNRTVTALLKRDWSLLAPGGYDREQNRGGGTRWVHVAGVGRSYPDHEFSPVPRDGSVRRDRQQDVEWLYLWNLSTKLLGVYGSHDRRWQLAAKLTEAQWQDPREGDAARIQEEFAKVRWPR